MNIYVTSAIAGLKEKLNGYVALLNYRYTNLCVKAELGALLPVTVIADKEYNLEDVAVIFTPTEYQFDIHPKLRDYLQPIIDGIFDVHPEFKLEIQQVEKSDDQRDKHLLYTMPEVNKDRRDLLNNTVKTFYDECKAHLEECNTKYEAKFVEILSEQPSEFEAAKDAVSDIYNDSKKQAEKLYAAKLEEIEKGYKRYLEQEEKKQSEESQKFDFTKGMPLNYEE